MKRDRIFLKQRFLLKQRRNTGNFPLNSLPGDLFSFLIFFILFVFFGTLAEPSLQAQTHSQNRIKLGILPIVNMTSQPYIDNLSSSIEEDILFTAGQLKNFTVIDSTAEKLGNPGSSAQLRKIARRKNADFLLSGQITRSKGNYLLTLFLFDSSASDGKGEIRATKEEEFFRMVDLFAASARLSFSLLEQLTGERIKRGIIYFVNETPGLQFRVTVNKKNRGENISSVELIEGSYLIQIFNISGVRKKIVSLTVKVKEGFPVEIPFNLSQKTILYDKKNTIRTNLYGMHLLFSPDEPHEGDDSNISGGGFLLPSFSYSRLFTPNIGINVVTGFIFVPDDRAVSEESRFNAGINFKAGPYFRFGRVAIIPMIGYSFFYETENISEYNLFDFIARNTVPSNNSASVIHAFELTFGFEVFFTPTVSLYLDTGFDFGTKIRIESGNNQYQYYSLFGLTTSLSLGISF